MYLHIGQNTAIKTNGIVGIFDMDTATIQKTTRNFLYKNEKNKRVIDVCSDLPKSFIVYKEPKASKIFITSLNSSTLLRRSNARFIKGDEFTNGI